MKVGLVLAGGGIKGIAHAGVLQALEENGISIDVIGGTSSGSLVAALYAIGYSAKEILYIFKKYSRDIVGIKKKNIVKAIQSIIVGKKLETKGLSTGEKLEKIFNKLAIEKKCKNIQDIKNIIISIPALNLNKSQKCVFTNYEEHKTRNIKLVKKPKEDIQYIDNIEISKAVRASSSFPGVFEPYKYKECLFLDGGAVDNVPVEEIRKCGVDKIMTVNFEEDNLKEECNIIDIATKTIDIMCDIMNKKNIEQSDVCIQVNTNNTGLLDVKRIDDCYIAGYSATINKIEEIRFILNNDKEEIV